MKRSGVFPVTLLLAIAVTFMIAFSACTVTKQGEGDNKRVDIRTPLGNMKVNTDVNHVDTGLAVYPNAKLMPKTGDDEGRANVNMDTPFFGLKVAAVKYTSDDSPAKILAFYQNEMKKYGDVIACQGGSHTSYTYKGKDKNGDRPVSCDTGTTRITIDTSSGAGIKVSNSKNDVELKVGTDKNQHIVAVKPSGAGTQFTLVYVRVHGGNDKGDAI